MIIKDIIIKSSGDLEEVLTLINNIIINHFRVFFHSSRSVLMLMIQKIILFYLF